MLLQQTSDNKNMPANHVYSDSRTIWKQGWESEAQPDGSTLRRTPRQIQRQQPPQDFVVGGLGLVVLPPVGGGDGFVERLVRHIEPCGTGVVKVGEGALFEVGGKAGFGDGTGWETGFLFYQLSGIRGHYTCGFSCLRGARSLSGFVDVGAG
jgi:hypothetical protein